MNEFELKPTSFQAKPELFPFSFKRLLAWLFVSDFLSGMFAVWVALKHNEESLDVTPYYQIIHVMYIASFYLIGVLLITITLTIIRRNGKFVQTLYNGFVSLGTAVYLGMSLSALPQTLQIIVHMNRGVTDMTIHAHPFNILSVAIILTMLVGVNTVIMAGYTIRRVFKK